MSKKKQRVFSVSSDDLIRQLDPSSQARITSVGAEPTVAEPLGAGDPAVKPGNLDDLNGKFVERRQQEQGLLGE
ncbi:MAG: hypothetical protein ACYDDN_07020 [Candidatus Desulforudaceae bacterium]|nr:hypothetical protein [Eubacteriales bacterium]MDZ7609264.1 hypothetical protein [Eubacteriales bacterium]